MFKYIIAFVGNICCTLLFDQSIKAKKMKAAQVKDFSMLSLLMYPAVRTVPRSLQLAFSNCLN